MLRRWISIIAVTTFLLAVFCVGFVFFYQRIQRLKVEASDASKSVVTLDTSKSLIDKPLPSAQLVDAYGAKVDDQVLRRGRIVLVFVTTECEACSTESKFLQTLLGRRKDITFYGLVLFEKRPDSPDRVANMFPFRVFYDEANSFVATMGINRVPVKVFLEDGIIKKGWIGAALTDKAQTSFVEWLDNLP